MLLTSQCFKKISPGEPLVKVCPSDNRLIGQIKWSEREAKGWCGLACEYAYLCACVLRPLGLGVFSLYFAWEMGVGGCLLLVVILNFSTLPGWASSGVELVWGLRTQWSHVKTSKYLCILFWPKILAATRHHLPFSVTLPPAHYNILWKPLSCSHVLWCKISAPQFYSHSDPQKSKLYYGNFQCSLIG